MSPEPGRVQQHSALLLSYVLPEQLRVSLAGSIIIALSLLAACQQNESYGPSPAPAKRPPDPSPIVQPPSAGDRVDVHGIAVKFLEGGAIELRGKDRWGNALDTTYENIEFLRNALPVLERAVTPEQAAGLRALLSGR